LYSQSSEDMAAQKELQPKQVLMVPRESFYWENFLVWRYENGDFPEGSHVLCKIDMKSTNMLMRDPLMYRIHGIIIGQEISGIYIRCTIMHMKWLYGANFAFDMYSWICDAPGVGFRPNLWWKVNRINMNLRVWTWITP
jgi:hypothetical protein